uniref:Uncharacterized protein n=1 Tax=Kalanchoe fedtschenkoi TaxID=63787 RepID=A0A7N0UHW2_KALFE
MASAAPTSHRVIQSPLTDLNSPNRISSSMSCCANFVVRVSTSLLLVISIAYFPSVAPGFVIKSVLSNSWGIFYSVVIGIVVSYILFGQRRVEKSVESKMSSDRLHMAKVLDVSDIWDCGFDFSCADGEVGWMPNLGNRWLGLPVRRLKSGKRAVSCGIGGGCGSRGSFGSGLRWIEESIQPFGDLKPLNLLEKFNEAVAFSSPISWSSRSVQICLRGQFSSAQSQSGGSVPREWLESNKEDDGSFGLKSRVDSQTESEFLGKAPFAPQKPHIVIVENANTTISTKDLKESSEISGESSYAKEGLDTEQSYQVTKGNPLMIGKSQRTIRGILWQVKDAGAQENDIGDMAGLNREAEPVLTTKPKAASFKRPVWDNVQPNHKRLNILRKLGLTKRWKRKQKIESPGHGNLRFVSHGAERNEVSSESEDLRHTMTDADSEKDEVDRKASEFIAKFREQMRLQKFVFSEEEKSLN